MGDNVKYLMPSRPKKMATLFSEFTEFKPSAATEEGRASGEIDPIISLRLNSTPVDLHRVQVRVIYYRESFSQGRSRQRVIRLPIFSLDESYLYLLSTCLDTWAAYVQFASGYICFAWMTILSQRTCHIPCFATQSHSSR